MKNKDFLIDESFVCFTFEDLKDSYIRKKDIRYLLDNYENNNDARIIQLIDELHDLID